MRRSILSRPALHVTAPAGVRMGRAAWRALRAGHGSVAAAFTSAVYIAGERGIACLVPASTPCGPLNVTLRGFRPGTPDLQGAPWRTIGSDLVVDGLGSFAISPSDEWTPASLPSASACALRDGLDAMRAALAARAPRGELLGHVPGSVPESPSHRMPGPAAVPAALGAHFARTLPALSSWLETMLSGRSAPSPAPVVDLLGAGSGLTPSGDDCVVGILVALRALGECDVASIVASLVSRHAPRRTTRLSAAHLDAACAGEAIEPVHEAIEAMATGMSPEPALDRLETYGHGSGFDALAGVLLAAEAIARSPEPRLHVHPRRRPYHARGAIHRQ